MGDDSRLVSGWSADLYTGHAPPAPCTACTVGAVSPHVATHPPPIQWQKYKSLYENYIDSYKKHHSLYEYKLTIATCERCEAVTTLILFQTRIRHLPSLHLVSASR